jgi:hypothetical protein
MKYAAFLANFVINNRLFCGIFVRKNHTSVEFNRGAQIQDLDNFLEGSGKYRRHLKIHKRENIKNKKVAYYVKQSFKLLEENKQKP